ncbi:copper-binding protein, partial [Xanthobacter wiegelii]
MRKLIMAAAISAFSTAALAQAAPVDGQITKIDQAQGKVTLKHGPIKN